MRRGNRRVLWKRLSQTLFRSVSHVSRDVESEEEHNQVPGFTPRARSSPKKEGVKLNLFLKPQVVGG